MPHQCSCKSRGRRRRRSGRQQRGRGPKMDKVKKVLRGTKKVWRPVVDKVMKVGINKLKKELGNTAVKGELNPVIDYGSHLIGQQLNRI